MGGKRLIWREGEKRWPRIINELGWYYYAHAELHETTCDKGRKACSGLERKGDMSAKGIANG